MAMITQYPTQFADPTPAHMQMMRVVPERFAGVLKGLTVPPPPGTDSDVVREELRGTMTHVASPTLDPEFCHAVDRDMTPIICSLARSHGVDADQAEIGELIEDLVPLILRVKYSFNFPRPWQIAAAAGVPLWHLHTQSSQTPSYPSGHAIQAAAACALLAERFPGAARSLDAIAGAVGRSRLQVGVHFPMDVRIGLKIGRQIGRRIAA